MEQLQVTTQQRLDDYRRLVYKRTCTIQELSEILSISKDKARQLTKIEGFPVIRIGKSIRIVLSELDGWLEQNIGMVM